MTGHIFLEGEIGNERDGAPVSVKSVRADIAQYPGATDWTVHINSGGGDVYEGYAIGNILASLPKTTAQIGASCCSIATYDAECCDKIVMSPHGDWMIHLPTGSVQGNADDFRRAASQLDRIKSELADKYMRRVGAKGVTRDQVLAMIEKETSMSPQEALKMGFIDDVQEKLKAVAKFDINSFQMETKEIKLDDESKNLFKSIADGLKGLMNKFKNAVQVALADGSMATSDAATPDALVGSTLTGADGTPLADGPYETADGYQITIAGGKVTAYEPLKADSKDDAKAENEALKKQVADLTAQVAAATQGKTAAEANIAAQAKETAEFKAQLTDLHTKFENLSKKTLGDDSAPDLNPNFTNDKNEPENKGVDPMAELGEAWLTSRPYKTLKR